MTLAQGFTQSELEALHILPGVSGGPENRFIQSCILYYKEWLNIHACAIGFTNIPTTRTLVLVYSESPSVENIVTPTDASGPIRFFKKTATLDNGLAVCNENLNTIFQFVPSFTDVNAAMNFILEKIPGDRCFAVILMAQKRMFVHLAGQDLEEWCNEPIIIPFDHTLSEITPDSIEKQVAIFHNESTRTHQAPLAKLMWNRAEVDFNGQPERHIQTGLLIHFRALLQQGAVIVDPEIENPGGRMDLRIARFSATPPSTVNTVIELKVLVPRKSHNEHTKWAISGVTQAHGYRNQQTDACLACLFDARKDKTLLLEGLSEKAKELDVRVSRYEMELPPQPADAEPKKKSAKKIRSGGNNSGQAGAATC